MRPVRGRTRSSRPPSSRSRPRPGPHRPSAGYAPHGRAGEMLARHRSLAFMRAQSSSLGRGIEGQHPHAASCPRHGIAAGGAWRRRNLRRPSDLARHAHRRQRGRETPCRSCFPQPRVADHDRAEILFAADQTADALLQGERRLRQLVVAKGTAALRLQMLDARPNQRILRRGEGQLSMMTSRSASPSRPRPPRSSPCRVAPHCRLRGNPRAAARAAPRPARTGGRGPRMPHCAQQRRRAASAR